MTVLLVLLALVLSMVNFTFWNHLSERHSGKALYLASQAALVPVWASWMSALWLVVLPVLQSLPNGLL